MPQVYRTRARIAGIVAVGLGLITAMSACSSTSNGSSSAASGGVVNIVQSSDIALTGWFSQTQPNLAVQRLIFNSLIEQDTKTLEPKPSLAKSWNVSSSNDSITFDLRTDVKFHDGTALTPDDVIASVKAMQRAELPSQLKGVANLITDMSASGQNQVTFKLQHPASNLFDMFEMMPVIDDKTLDKLLTGDEFNGTGPFEVDRYTPGQGLKLVRFKDYWGGAPHLDGVNMKVVRDSQSMVTALRSGDAQMAVDLAPLDALAVTKDPNFNVYTAPAQDAGYYLAANVKAPVLANKEVRKAIAYAIDRDRILKQVLGGNGRISSLPWSPSSPANDKALTGAYTYDKAKATEMLKSLGVAGQKVKLYYDANNGITTGIAQVVAFNLKEAGLDPVPSPLQSPDFLSRMRAGSFDGLFVNVHGFGQMAPVTLVTGAFPFNANGNAEQFDNSTYKQIASDLAQATDKAHAQELIKQLNNFLIDQEFVIDLVATGHTYTMTSKLKDMSATLLDYPILDKAYLNR